MTMLHWGVKRLPAPVLPRARLLGPLRTPPPPPARVPILVMAR